MGGLVMLVLGKDSGHLVRDGWSHHDCDGFSASIVSGDSFKIWSRKYKMVKIAHLHKPKHNLPWPPLAEQGLGLSGIKTGTLPAVITFHRGPWGQEPMN